MIIADFSIKEKKFNCLILFSFFAVSLAIILNTGLDTINNNNNAIFVFAQENNTVMTSNAQGQENNMLIDDAEAILGQPFYVESTKSTNMRVISVDNPPVVEVSYKGNSSIDGSPTQTIGTIVDRMGTEGAVHSKGQAIILTATGQVITYKSESLGYYNPDGSFSDSGIILFSLPFQSSNNNNTGIQDNTSEDSYLDFNNVLGIYKKTVDPLGNGLTKVWIWS